MSIRPCVRMAMKSSRKNDPMKSDNRLWRTLHVLLHMNESQAPMTSQAIGEMLNTNAVVVRRTMAGLRERHYVVSEKGHGGGWRLNCRLDEMTLFDVYEALGQPAIFALGEPQDSQGCLVEQAVNDALGEVLTQAKNLLLERFKAIKISQIEQDFEGLKKRLGVDVLS